MVYEILYGKYLFVVDNSANIPDGLLKDFSVIKALLIVCASTGERKWERY